MGLDLGREYTYGLKISLSSSTIINNTSFALLSISCHNTNWVSLTSDNFHHRLLYFINQPFKKKKKRWGMFSIIYITWHISNNHYYFHHHSHIYYFICLNYMYFICHYTKKMDSLMTID